MPFVSKKTFAARKNSKTWKCKKVKGGAHLCVKKKSSGMKGTHKGQVRKTARRAYKR
jgi:hypothetical protein